MVAVAPGALGVQALLGDIGVEVGVGPRADVAAAEGIASRRGLGKVRHMRVQQLWLQEKVASGEIDIRKIEGKTNMADAFTKALDPKELEEHMERVGMVPRGAGTSWHQRPAGRKEARKNEATKGKE